MHRIALAVIVALIAVPVPRARAHVAPALDTNNRYLQLTPMRDRVRLAYTVFLGEIPGAQARKRLDRNRDGTVDETEASAYADELAAAVRQNLEITVQGTVQAISWAEVHVGLGTPLVQAGAFSVDLIAWICLDGSDRSSEHTLTLRDRFRLPPPGETELRVQESPGIAIHRSMLGATGPGPEEPQELQNVDLAFQWRGSEVPLATEGYRLTFSVDPAAALVAVGGACGAAEPPGREPGWRRLGWPGLAIAVLVLLGVGWRLWRGLRRKRA